MEHVDTYLACSDCFSDVGLRLDAEQIGAEQALECPNCNSAFGRKLTHADINDLAHRFFVNGSIFRSYYGAAPTIQYNGSHFNNDTLDVPDWLKGDLKLIGQILEVGFFHYGPRLWTLGHIEPLKALQVEVLREEVIDRIIKKVPKTTLPQLTSFYRVRKNPEDPSEFLEYDTPPDQFLGSGRLDAADFPVFYASQDIETCIHESRVTIEDELYVASLSLTQDVIVLDLTNSIEEEVTEFESLSLSIHFLFRATSHSYEILRRIARAAHASRFDGILYPSYFTQIHRKSEDIKNLALFGRPISNGTLKVDCINRVMLERVSYDIHFGPAGF